MTQIDIKPWRDTYLITMGDPTTGATTYAVWDIYCDLRLDSPPLFAINGFLLEWRQCIKCT